MKRLLNIDRPGGFPLCAETLGVLSENGEMLAEWLKRIPLENRQAVRFGDYLLVCENFQKRVVKTGLVSAVSRNQCKLVFHTETHSVHDSSDNEIANVWTVETADIVTESSPSAQWTLLSFADVFELKLWEDWLPAFEAGLPIGLSVGTVVGENPVHGLDRITGITLYGDDNELSVNSERARMKVAIRYQGISSAGHVIQLPLPFTCPDGVRMDADVEATASGTHYPIEVYTSGGALMVCVGRWLRDEGLIPDGSHTAACDVVIRINKEVLL